MDEMNRTTMRYPKLEQIITATEFMLECEPENLDPDAIPLIQANLPKMRDLDRKIKTIPYDSGDDDTDRANSRKYSGLEKLANALIRTTTNLLWPSAQGA